MPIDPAVVRAQEFRVVFRGYDVEEVDAFLDWIEQELTRPAPAHDAGPPAEPAHAGAAVPALRTLVHAEQAVERMLAEAAAEAAVIRERAHAEAWGIVADAREQSARLLATAAQRPPAAAEELVLGAQRLRAELDRLGESERRCREQLQSWLDGHDRLLGPSPVPSAAGAAPDPGSGDTGTTVRRVVTTLPKTAFR